MDTSSTLYRAHQCYKCPGDTEYYCESCPGNLCPHCKENHIKDLKTIDHNVLTCNKKLNCIKKQEVCVRHPSNFYKKYCDPCQLPVCDSCTAETSHKFRNVIFGQEGHKMIDIQGVYNAKQQQYRGTIHTIRSEALFYRHVLLTEIKTDFKICHTKLSPYQSEMLKRAHKLKSFIEDMQKKFMCNKFRDFDFKHTCLKTKKKINTYINWLQLYEQKYEQSVFSSLRNLSFIIKTIIPKIHLPLHTSRLSMIESLKKDDVMKLLSSIQTTERGNRRVGNECLLKLMSGAELHQSLLVSGVDGCLHISCMKSDQIWVSDSFNLILKNTKGAILHRVEDLGRSLGPHTVNSESELVYIDNKYNINKLSKDMKTTTKFIERTDSNWKPQCVYCSPISGHLLVGSYNRESQGMGKVARYNQNGLITKTIQQESRGHGLYRKPNYITENNNGDVVVSDYLYMPGGVVVTDRGGKHRFSYTNHPSGTELSPRGICTDALSHILVSDRETKTILMLNRDGKFMLYLLTTAQNMDEPWSLSYDVYTHRLWVGSWYNNNKVCVYRYITRQDTPTSKDKYM